MIAWKIYAVTFSVISIFSGLGRLVIFFKQPSTVSRLDLISGFYNYFMLPGLIGYAWHRAIGSRSLWIVGVLLLLGFNAAELFSPKMSKTHAKLGTTKFTFMIAGQILLGGPALYALICYAFFTADLWK